MCLHIYGRSRGRALQNGNLHAHGMVGNKVAARITHHSLIRKFLRSLGIDHQSRKHQNEKG